MTSLTANEVAALVAKKFRLLADPTRLAILCTLMGSDELNVGTVVIKTGRTQANVSKHLKTLMSAGCVGRRKEGLQVYYRLDDPIVEKLYQLGRDSVLGASSTP